MDKKKIATIALTLSNSYFKKVADVLLSDNDSGSDDDEIEEFLITIGLPGSKEKPTRIQNYVEKIVQNYTSVDFQQNFRMSREAFDNLHEKYCSYMDEMKINANIPNEKQLLSIIWLLATPECYRSVGKRFDMAKSTLSVVFFRVIDFLIKISSTIIKFPDVAEKRRIKNYFEHNNKLKGVIGAIDGTYIKVKAPADQKSAYTNRKCFQSVTLQAICDDRKKFLDCFVGYPSSVHDCRIFKNSPFYKKVMESNPFFEEGEKILGDKAYPALPWCLPPYIDRGRMTEMQKYFNKVHAQVRVIIEQRFGLLYGRLRRLRYIDMNKTEYIPSTIIAACVIHNICFDFEEENFRNQYIQEGLSFVQNSIHNENQLPAESLFSTQNGVAERTRIAEELWQNRH